MAAPTAPEGTRELAPRSRAIGVVAWCSFLAAGLGTMFCFAFLDPVALRECNVPDWWSNRLHVYALGFFFFWFVAAVAAAVAVFLVRSERGSDYS
jgi:hypothetical protein